MKLKIKFLTTFLATLAVTLLVAAPIAQAQGKKLAAQQVLKISLLGADIQTLDPMYSSGTQDTILVNMIFNALIRYKPGLYPEIEADLAEEIPKPKMVGGKQVWDFRLRKGVICHPFPGYPNGYEITSEDVVYSLKRVADPKRSGFSGQYTDVADVKALDKYTVRITLERPLSITLFHPKVVNFNGGFVLPKKAVEAIGDRNFRTQPVGTGPFILEKYLPKERVILRRHPRYFRGKPVLEEVHGILMADVTAAELALMKGELDAAIGPSQQTWVDKMEAVEGITVDVYGPGENCIIHYNMKKPPLDKLEVRKAIAYCLSRREMSALFGKRIASPAYSPIPLGSGIGALTEEDLKKAGIDWEVGSHDVDLERAKKLLASAGYPKGGINLEVYASERKYYVQPYQVVQAALKKIGINLKINVVDHASYHSLIRKDANSLVFYNVHRATADMLLSHFYHSSAEVVSGKSPITNFSHVNNVDELIEKARYETNAEKQIKLWKEIQLNLYRNAVTSAFCLIRMTTARSESIHYGHPTKAHQAYIPTTETTCILEKGR
ncbi:MAG: ABC transporter substrate-binding protein [Candidatus Hodarchaeota archaeon]